MKTMKWLNAIKWLVVLAVMCMAAWLAVTWNRRGGVSVEAGFDSRIELTPQEIRRIESVGQWEFLSVQCEVVADTSRRGIFSDDRLVAIYTGTPRLGIDMADAGEGWAHAHGDTVTLRLPVVKLLDGDFIDETRTRVFFERGTWPNAARARLYEKARRKMLRQCLTPSNLRSAEENARNQFASLFTALGFQTVEIAFE